MTQVFLDNALEKTLKGKPIERENLYYEFKNNEFTKIISNNKYLYLSQKPCLDTTSKLMPKTSKSMPDFLYNLYN